jgi:hypothetical protein
MRCQDNSLAAYPTKRRVNPGLGFFSFHTARRTIGGYEAMVRHEVELITVKRVQAMTSPAVPPAVSYRHALDW